MKTRGRIIFQIENKICCNHTLNLSMNVIDYNQAYRLFLYPFLKGLGLPNNLFLERLLILAKKLVARWYWLVSFIRRNRVWISPSSPIKKKKGLNFPFLTCNHWIIKKERLRLQITQRKHLRTSKSTKKRTQNAK